VLVLTSYADQDTILPAKVQGRNGGRPAVMEEDKLAAATARRERGESPAQIARALGVSRAQVCRAPGLPAPGRRQPGSLRQVMP
jgi:DNA invertase Pin-like site-specific DNA recombinase